MSHVFTLHRSNRVPAFVGVCLYLFALCLFALGLLSAPSLSFAAHEKPNIIVIFTDDHGYTDLSCQEIVEDIKTPHIDVLASGGVRMTSGYVTAPQCVPSRAGLLTGRYQNRFGVESNGEPLDGFNAQETIAERLKKAGYATGMTGKWHLGPPAQIVSHGFDDVYYKNANRPGWSNFNLDGSDREPGAEDSQLYHLDANSAAACAFIKRHHDEPFFFYCAYRAPHVPLDAPPKYLNRFPGEMPQRRRQALAMISAVDDGVGQIMATLREYDLEDNTVIFFIGDNGAPLKIHKLDAPGGGAGWDGSLNDPLNGEKGMLAEGGIRVPFVVYWKGKLVPQVYDSPVISLDVAATACALAGLEQDSQLDGVNLIPYLCGETVDAPHESLYWRWIAQAAVREGKWKYLRGGAREYLYDLGVDREEKNNLIEKHPEIAAGLQRKLAAWAGELTPPGLETKQMATTWEQYFDYYLDGKPAPTAAPNNRPDDQKLQGWVARNGSAQLTDEALAVTATAAPRQAPFIACASLHIAGPAIANIRLRSLAGGAGGIAWRTESQKDFPLEQKVPFNIAGSDNWQQIAVVVPAKGPIIHIRLVLPGGVNAIQRVELSSSEQPGSKVWDFKKTARPTR